MSIRSIAYNRHIHILDVLKEQGMVRVEDLSRDLGVSGVTIRRDLDYLNSKGLLLRTHGGANMAPARKDILQESEFNEKGTVNVPEKERIGARCADLIQTNDIVFLNSGSTAIFFLQALAGRKVKVITNNAAAIQSSLDPKVEVMYLGGEYREQSRSFVGEFALNTIRDIYSHYTVLGTNGISTERGITTTVYQECAINQAMIDNTHGKVIVIADHTKLGRVSNFVSAPLNVIDILVTDTLCPPEFREELESRGISVFLA
ncbi:MAG: DeoR/GlpR transcriptional regulator [Spirochaetaceae bacterium]|nr:MAG: DeoR/GlpR transcriptional regulator [Spirochaetaceae bacterium]